jgi:integrase
VRRKVKIRPVPRDVLLAHKPLYADPDALVFGTAAGKPQNPSNVRRRVVTRAVELANKRLTEAGEAPLPRLTPHGLRLTYASLLYGIGEPPPVVMQEMAPRSERGAGGLGPRDAPRRRRERTSAGAD